MNCFQDIGHKIIEMVHARSSAMAEVFICESYGNKIDVSNQEIQDYKVSHVKGMGLRVLLNNRWGFSYTSNTNESDIDELVSKSIINAHNTSEDTHNILPGPYHLSKSFDNNMLYDSTLKTIKQKEKIELVKFLERNALSHDRRIQKVPNSIYSDSTFSVYLLNSQGIDIFQQGTICSVSIVALAQENGQMQIGIEYDDKRIFADLEIDSLGKTASRRAVSLLGAKTIPTQKATVVFSPRVACEFIDLISESLCADAVQRGKSLFKDKIGLKIASQLVNIVDDGTLPGGLSTAPYDDEGVPSQRTLLVTEGILQGYLYDSYTASRDKVLSTGNASRSSYKQAPFCDTTNIYLENGISETDDLIADVSNGIYVMETIGMHMANPVSGEFSVGVSGLRIENGSLTYPVGGITIASNIKDLLQSIDCVGKDLKFFGSTGSPTIRIADIMIAGH